MEDGSGSAVAPSRTSGSEQVRALLPIKSLVLDSLSSPHSRRAYDQALTDFFAWYVSAPRWRFSRAVVQEYRVALEGSGLAASTINVRLAAVRKLASEAADNGLMTTELANGIARVRGTRRRGVRLGNWLSGEEASRLLAAPSPETPAGKRDRAILALLIACGLRRAELAKLRLERIQMREGRWVIVDLEGKGNRLRTVAIPLWVKNLIDLWAAEAGVQSGPLFRAVNKSGRVWGEGMTEKVIWSVVRRHALNTGLPAIAPHDLRRTCAKLCRAAGGDLEQIQFLLGHSSVQTTERYLGTKQNLKEAVNDALGIQPPPSNGAE